MSNGNGTAPSISDQVSNADLNIWASIAGVLRWLGTVDADPAPPATAGAFASTAGASIYANTYAQLRNSGAPAIVAHTWAGWMSTLGVSLGQGVAVIAEGIGLLVGPLFGIVLDVLDGIRKGADPAVTQLAVSVLNELLGTDFSQQQMPLGLGVGDHLSRAKSIGALLVTQLETEFLSASGGTVSPSAGPAETFSGLAINFGLASAIMGLIGGAVPGAHLEELRELGEEVAQNIGLGRLVRRALQPYVQILVQQPLTWLLHQRYHPTQFSTAELVNPFSSVVMSQQQIYTALDLLGYSDDKKQAFIELHQKRLSVDEVELLVRWGAWTAQQGHDYVAQLGWPAELVDTVLTLPLLKRADTRVNQLLTAIEGAAEKNQITIDEFNAVVNALPISTNEKPFIASTVLYKAHAPIAKHKTLTNAQELTAFENGLVTADDLFTRWQAQGYSSDDQTLLLALALIALKKFEAAQAKAAATAAKAAAKTTTTTTPTTPTTPAP